MKLAHAFSASILLLSALPVAAEIVIEGGVAVSFAPHSGLRSMPSIVFVAPSASASPDLNYNLQRAHAWSSYQRGNNATGAGLVFSPALGAPQSPRQSSVRGNISRAQAFRLEYNR